jgi:hypothetical protein
MSVAFLHIIVAQAKALRCQRTIIKPFVTGRILLADKRELLIVGQIGLTFTCDSKVAKLTHSDIAIHGHYRRVAPLDAVLLETPHADTNTAQSSGVLSPAHKSLSLREGFESMG